MEDTGTIRERLIDIKGSISLHDEKTAAHAASIMASAARQERVMERLEDNVEKLSASVNKFVMTAENTADKVQPWKLIMWLVAAVILSALGQRGLDLLTGVR